MGKGIKKQPISPLTRLHRQAWRKFDYGLITKSELIQALEYIQNSKGELIHVK